MFCSRPVLPFFHCYFPQRSLHTLLVIHIDWLVNNPNLFLNMCQISNRCQNVLRNLWDVKRVFNGRRKRRWDLCGWIWSVLYVLSFFFIFSFFSFTLCPLSFPGILLLVDIDVLQGINRLIWLMIIQFIILGLGSRLSGSFWMSFSKKHCCFKHVWILHQLLFKYWWLC